MKASLSCALLLALAPLAMGAPADPSSPAAAPVATPAATPDPVRAAAQAWLAAHGLACNPDTFVAQAATAGQDTVAQFLAAGLDPDCRDAHGTPALVSALSGWKNLARPEFNPYRDKLVNDRLEVLELLLARGADPSLRDRQGFQAIHHAAEYEPFWPAVELLKRAGADLESETFEYRLKPLHLAVIANNAFGAKALLSAGAASNGDADPVMAPLPNAVRADRPLMVAVLLHFGADLKRPLPGQVSCLHLAAEKASLRTIRVLVEAGADRTALDAQQRTPQDIARAKGRGPEVLAALAPAS